MVEKRSCFIAHFREKDGKEQCLWEHLEATAKLASEYAAKIGLEKSGEISGLAHDDGKATELFFQYICSAVGLIDPDEDDYLSAEGYQGKIDHSSAGAQLIYNYLAPKGGQASIAAQYLALVVASHHSGMIDCLTPGGINKFEARMKKAFKLTRADEAEENLDPAIKDRIYSLLDDPSLIKEIADKTEDIKESNDTKSTFSFKKGLLLRMLFSCLIDADRTNTIAFEKYSSSVELKNGNSDSIWLKLSERLEADLRKFKVEKNIDQIRTDISVQCLKFATKDKGVFQLTVPTGGGKTLSSLRFAINHAMKHKMDKVIYVIPYTSIIDQNADKIRQILEPPDESNQIVLEHHSNLTPEKENEMQKMLAQNWDAPVVFTTMVQFLETLFGGGTRSVRRMHQLANSVIIFDEIQTLPIKCVHMFNLAIRFLVKACGTTAVLCTATQPLLDEVTHLSFALPIPDDKKIIEDVPQLFKDLKRVEIIPRIRDEGWTVAQVAELAVEEQRLTGSVLIVVNTKTDARGVNKQLHDRLGDCNFLYHLSTSMCPAHRMKVLNEIKDRLEPEKGLPVICVSTQLIEAGVDIDFGSVIRFLAGLDSIAQAAGRCNRHGTRKIVGRVHIVNPINETLASLPDIEAGARITERIISEYSNNPENFDNNLIGDKAIRQYYQYYYYEKRNGMSYRVGKKSNIGRDDDLVNLLSSNKISEQGFEAKSRRRCNLHLKQSFESAAKEFKVIASNYRGVLVPYEEGTSIIADLCGELSLPEFYEVLKKAQRYSVNVLDTEFGKLRDQKAIYETKKGSGVFYVDKRYYNKHTGLSLVPDGEMEFMNP